MKKSAVLVAILAFNLAGCVSSSSNSDQEKVVTCSYEGTTFYCPESNTCGNGFCIQNTDNECGASMAVCGTYEECRDAACQCNTSGVWSVCSGTCCKSGCVDTMTDSQNCGACGKKCEAGVQCLNGKCQEGCSDGLMECRIGGKRVCKDTQNDAEHCGGCEHACPVASADSHVTASLCLAGVCHLICDGDWRDEDNDVENGCEANIPSSCSNGIVEPSEECDGLHLNDKTCASVVGAGSEGVLRCSSDCQSFITDDCSASTLCGNGELDDGEKCDGTNVGDATCESLVGTGSTGTVGCLTNCTDFDVRKCTKPNSCGNGVVDAGEKCDIEVKVTATCAEVVGTGSTGTVGCAENCANYDILNCTAAAKCGNGLLEAGEECDRSNFGSATCATIVGSGSTGVLSCNSQCAIDSTRCSKASTCGNNKIDGPERCDGKDLNGKTCTDAVGKGSTGTLKCAENCGSYDISNCTAPASCNNGRLENGETCDGSRLNDKSCADIVGAGSVGQLRCNSTCTKFVTTGCSKATNCGNNKIDSDEKCDGMDVGSATCESKVGKGSKGKVLCSMDCQMFDYSNCSAPELCNNGVLNKDSGEVCDGTNLDSETCESIVGTGSTGTLKCGDGCMHFDISDCSPSKFCGDGRIQTGEKCDMTNLGGRTCASPDALGEGAYGTLMCNSTCTGLDTSKCKKPESGSEPPSAVCGNGIIEEGEACDKTAFGSATCKSELSNASATGTLKCSGDCKSIVTEDCVFCGDGSLNGDYEECDGTDWIVDSCVEYDPRIYSGGTLRCDRSSCMLDPKDCTLKDANYACEEEGEFRCSDSTHLVWCMDHHWEDVYNCGSDGTYPYCSAASGDCLPSAWCNIQSVTRNGNGDWDGFGRYRPIDGVAEPAAYMYCTKDLNQPVMSWASTFTTAKNTSCLECGDNVEYGTNVRVSLPSGTNYCTFVFWFGDQGYVCPPIKNGVSEPIQLKDTLRLTPETSYIVNN